MLKHGATSKENPDLKRHYPPAYYRYREKHKTISVLLSDSLKRALDRARGERSYTEFIKSLFIEDGLFSQLEKQTLEIQKAWSEIRTEKQKLAAERAELKNTERFKYWCKLCGERFVTKTAAASHRLEKHPGRKSIIKQF